MLHAKKPAAALCCWLLLTGLTPGWRPLLAAQAPPSDDLKIVIIEGEGFTNSLRRRIAREPVVEVRDRNDKPVAGAAVTFALPSSGPSGTFANGSRILNVVTGADGRATASVFRANDVAGAVKMEVTATHQGATASTVITSTNVAAAAGAGLGAAATLGIIGAAAAATAVTLVRVLGGGKSSTVSVSGPTLP